MIEFFCKNTEQFLTANYICKNAPSLMFGIVLNTRDLRRHQNNFNKRHCFVFIFDLGKIYKKNRKYFTCHKPL